MRGTRPGARFWSWNSQFEQEEVLPPTLQEEAVVAAGRKDVGSIGRAVASVVQGKAWGRGAEEHRGGQSH